MIIDVCDWLLTSVAWTMRSDYPRVCDWLLISVAWTVRSDHRRVCPVFSLAAFIVITSRNNVTLAFYIFGHVEYLYCIIILLYVASWRLAVDLSRGRCVLRYWSLYYLCTHYLICEGHHILYHSWGTWNFQRCKWQLLLAISIVLESFLYVLRCEIYRYFMNSNTFQDDNMVWEMWSTQLIAISRFPGIPISIPWWTRLEVIMYQSVR